MREEGVAEIRRFVEFLSAGRDEAAQLVEQMLELPASGWDAWLAAHPAALSVHALNFLLDEAERDPQRALALTELVTRHADSVTTPAEAVLAGVFLRGRAWAGHARALRAARRVGEALQAYDSAAAIFRAELAAYQELEDVEREAAQLRAGGAAQDRTADDGLASILKETPAAELRRRIKPEDLRNSGLFDALSREIASRLHRVPAEALFIAELATETVETLPPDLYPPVKLAQLRAQAWKDRASPLCYLARYSEALSALDRAEAILAPFDALAHDRAIVRLARANTLQEAGRYDEAVELLTECTTVFKESGDTRRQLFCGILKGSLLYRVGKRREARDAWLALLPIARAANDVATVATLHNNIGFPSVDLGDFETADEHVQEAVRLFQQLGRPLDAARSELVRGRMMVKQGETERGIAHLQCVRGQFLEHNLIEEAGLCGLDIVKASLSRGASHEAETLARRIVHEFTGAHLNSRAITALGYLSDAIVARSASAVTVENVRHFIEKLRRDPEAEFRATA